MLLGILLWKSIYILCSVCCLNPINVETAEPIRSKFCMATHITLVRGFIEAQNHKNLFVFKKFRFSQNFENDRKNIVKSANFFVIIVQRENAYRYSKNKNIEINSCSGILKYFRHCFKCFMIVRSNYFFEHTLS